MAITYTGAHTWAGGASTPTTASINTSSPQASLVVVACSSYGGGTQPTVQDSNDNATWTLNSWSQLSEYFSASGSTIRLRLWYAMVTAGTTSTTHYFRASGATVYSSLYVAAFAGTATSSVYDTPNEAGAGMNGSATLATGAITPSAANYLVVSGLGTGQESLTTTPSAGFTATDFQVTIGGSYFGGSIAYSIQSGGPSSANCTWTISSGIYYGAASIASFKAAPSGGSPLIRGGQLTHGVLMRGGRLAP